MVLEGRKETPAQNRVLEFFEDSHLSLVTYIFLHYWILLRMSHWGMRYFL
jgi:hypothetical protein